MSTSKLAVIEPRSTEIEALAGRIVPAFPRDCSPEQAAEVARIALAYGLDPFLGELIPYQGRPYLTLEGRTRVAENNPHYDGYEHGPVTGEELKALQPKPGEALWKCTVYRKDRSHPTVAYGRAGGPNERNPVAKNDPITMAQKRAIHRALRAAFPVPIPGEVGRDDDPIDPPATAAQITAIHAADDAAGVTITERHDALEAQFGVSASNELTTGQASAYLDQRKAQPAAQPVPTWTREDAAAQPRETDVSGDWETALRSAATSQAVEAIWREMHDSGDQNKATKALMLECWGRCLLREEAEARNVFVAKLVDVMRKIGIDAYSKLNREIVREIGETAEIEQARIDAEEDDDDDAEYQALINVDLETGEVTDAS